MQKVIPSEGDLKIGRANEKPERNLEEEWLKLKAASEFEWKEEPKEASDSDQEIPGFVPSLLWPKSSRFVYYIYIMSSCLGHEIKQRKVAKAMGLVARQSRYVSNYSFLSACKGPPSFFFVVDCQHNNARLPQFRTKK